MSIVPARVRQPGATVVDGGIHRTPGGLPGDVQTAESTGVAARVTPVPSRGDPGLSALGHRPGRYGEGMPEPAARRATLKDVAAASGVSRATVTFVLNDTPNQTISPATRERVQRAARELGYVPHAIARALREGASRIVVLLVDTGMEGNYSRSYVRGLDQELAAHGHVLLVRHGEVTDAVREQISVAVRPRAVLRFGEAYLSDEVAEHHEDFAAHATRQISYLAERGRSRVALALPPGNPPLARLRLMFARQATRQLGLDPPVRVTIPASRAAAAAALRRLRDAHPAVDALATFDDDTALRALRALADLGWSAPADLAVIGYDDTEHGALFSPALTTVHIDAEGHGRIAARRVLGLDTTGIEPALARVITRESA